jgi:hypothetical protein
MSDFKHRNIKELKAFIKKYNDHFKIKVTGKKKADLVKEINDGMKKTVSDKLKKEYEMLTLKPIKSKPLEKPVDKPKSQLPAKKTRVVKSEPVRSTPAPKPQRKIPKNRRGGIPDIDKEISSLLKTSKKLETQEAKKPAPKKPAPKKDDGVEGLKAMVKSAEEKEKKRKVSPTIYKDIVDKMKLLLTDRKKVARINQLVDDNKSFRKIKNLKEWFDERLTMFRELEDELEKLMKKNKNINMTQDQERVYNRVLDFFESNRFYSN